MDIPDILGALEDFTPGKFPRRALAAAVKQQEEITSELLAILDYVHHHFDAAYANERFMAPCYALFLLAQFRERRAYPLIVQVFSRPGDEIEDMFGDIITEDLGRILASVSHGDTTLMRELAENREANPWIRGAALDGMVCLAANGVIPREEVVTYLKSLFPLYENESEDVVGGLAGSCLDIYPGETYEDIKKALEEDRIDPMLMTLETVDYVIEEGEEKTLNRLRENRHYRFVEDTIKEMEWWASFQEPPDTEEESFPFLSHDPDPDDAPPEAPIRPKIGRNEPCPCGSGKKFKKCCGA